MYHFVLKFDHQESKIINFTPDLFESGVIFNRLPVGIYISNLYPHKGRFFDAMNAMFDEIDKRHLKVRYSAPGPKIELFLLNRGYQRYIDPAGTPVYTNTKIPKSCVEATRTEEEIARLNQQAEYVDNEFSQ